MVNNLRKFVYQNGKNVQQNSNYSKWARGGEPSNHHREWQDGRHRQHHHPSQAQGEKKVWNAF